MNLTSLKTTASGGIIAIVALLNFVQGVIETGQLDLNTGSMLVIAAASAFLGGSARDNNVNSEAAGAKV